MSLSKPENKRPVNFECHAFIADWSVNYFVIELDDEALCVLCDDNISILEEYNIRRHCQTKRVTKYSQFTEKQRSSLILFFLSQDIFFAKIKAVKK